MCYVVLSRAVWKNSFLLAKQILNYFSIFCNLYTSREFLWLETNKNLNMDLSTSIGFLTTAIPRRQYFLNYFWFKKTKPQIQKTTPSFFLSTNNCKQLSNLWSFTENIILIFWPPLLPVISCYKWISANLFYLVLLECIDLNNEGLEWWLVICPFSYWVSSHSSRLYHCHILPMQVIFTFRKQKSSDR